MGNDFITVINSVLYNAFLSNNFLYCKDNAFF